MLFWSIAGGLLALVLVWAYFHDRRRGGGYISRRVGDVERNVGRATSHAEFNHHRGRP